MDKEYRDLITAIRKGYGYDYVANHYYDFTKDDLKGIILECLYVIEDADKLESIAEELKDRFDY